jgi:molybdopterin/thiamine biosynthesis adenylyltransferase
MEVKYSRFSKAPWFKEDKNEKETIVIGGAGGIGSWVSLFLSRIGHKLIIYDMDEVDETNMAGQCYTHSTIGMKKVDAVKDVCKAFSNNEIETNDNPYDEKSVANYLIVSCFDNMKARKIMFERWLDAARYYYKKNMTEHFSKCLFVDGRMTAEQGQIYFVKPNKESIDKYRETLFEDGEVEDLPCSFKATSHNGAMIASQMISGINNHLSNVYVGFEFRPVPSKIKYMLETFLYETE